MPTPVGHSLAGYFVFSAIKKPERNFKWTELVAAVIIANLPDADFIPGMLAGNPNKFHHGITHSIGFAVIVGLLAGIVYFSIRKKHFFFYSAFFFLCYSSHLLLDYLGADTRAPFGEQLFWPISQIYVMSPVSVFSDVHKASDSSIFLQSLFNWHNFRTILIECAILIPMIGLLNFMKNKLKKSTTA
ncbi:hypothetical protein GF337_11090 [candidate division KSB1 bacterium]|nr:hypothetical protein [candidate division KSB1 bacterium]